MIFQTISLVYAVTETNYRKSCIGNNKRVEKQVKLKQGNTSKEYLIIATNGREDVEKAKDGTIVHLIAKLK